MVKPRIGELSFELLLGGMLLAFVVVMLMLPSVTFLAGYRLTPWHFPVSLVIVYVTVLVYSRKGNLTRYFKAIGAHLALVASAVFAASVTYDTSYDGQAYHQETVYQLKNGWNPAREIPPDSVSYAIWINHYAKGAELSSAVIYGFTDRIESGKATNILLAVAGFFLCVCALTAATPLSRYKVLLLSAFAALNPVTITQLFSFCIDGQLASLLLCLASACCLVFAEASRTNLVLLGLSMLMVINIKFTGVPFVGIFIIGLFAIMVFRRRTNDLKRTALCVAIAGAAAIGIAGYNPYVKNSLSKGHPFYPLMTASGKPAVDIFIMNTPVSFREKNRFEKFFISIFSHTENVSAYPATSPRLKIPFSVDRMEIRDAVLPDTRIAALGPFFCGIFLLAVGLVVGELVRVKSLPGITYMLYALTILAVSIFIVSEAWWARLVPQLWLVPLLFILLLELASLSPLSRRIKSILYLALFFNIGLSLLSIPKNIVQTIFLRYQLAEMRASRSPVLVNFGFLPASRTRLREAGINYREVTAFPAEKNESWLACSSTRYRIGPTAVSKEPRYIGLLRKIPGADLRTY
ncbi:hypothetical protein [Hufsiella ginkgonis]|uniref:Glycosyltransferase RgtA/B/C/D-like domain-containing protein n=1 Tax=Hufsiella ginkgonis TaxID=2695274 RepID=A0A7K1Y1Y2_9SPHI|nr:hypothetical protein [Hufsiella ginkgonis]MXV17029.1 hypothetical protein [Hufsiella ginkgonis]